jgi:VWFA-related protein
MKSGRAASASVVIAVGLLSSPGLGQEPAVPSFPAQANAITADVVVLDKEGRPVRGLTREDFTLLADGKPQTIVAFQARELETTAASPAPTMRNERVTTNENGGRGRTFAFLIDDLKQQQVPLEEAKSAIVRWLQEKAHPDDELTLATASGDSWWSDRIDRGRTDFLAVLDRVKARGTMQEVSDWDAYRVEMSADSTGASLASAGGAPQNPDLQSSPTQRAAQRSGAGRFQAQMAYAALVRRIQALLGATERLSRGLAGARGRKSIVIFSEGFLYDPNQLRHFDRSIDAAQRANTAVYFVDAKGLSATALFRASDPSGVTYAEDGRPNPANIGMRSIEKDFLETSGSEMVAENTGGSSIRNTNDLLGGLERIAQESSTYYLLGYQPERAPDGNWHKLEVKVARPGLKVRTRHGYQALPPPALALAPPVMVKKEKKDAKEKGPKRPLDPAVMTSGAGDALPLRLASYVLDADKTGLARVLVVLELDTSRLTFHREGVRQTGSVDLTLVGMSRDFARMFPVDERVRVDVGAKAAGGWMTLTRELRLPSGVAQVRALVRDVASGLGGTVTQRLEVPALEEPFLATPILTNQMIMVPGKGTRLVPVAYRRFRPRGVLYCSYEVLGMTNAKGEATTHVTGGFTLRGSAGRIVRQAAPTPIAVALGGKVMRILVLALAGLEPGAYDLALDIVDESSGRTLQWHEPFELVPGAT